MQNLPYDRLTSDERLAFYRALDQSYQMETRVDLYSKNEEYVGRLNPGEYPIIDGTVEVDSKAKYSRILTLTLVALRGLDITDAVVSGPFHPAKFLQILYCVKVTAIDAWVEVPVMYAIPDKVEYDVSNRSMTITGLPKESLMMPPNKSPKGLNANSVIGRHKSMRLDAFIARVASEFGETKLRLTVADKEDRVDPEKSKFDSFTRKKGVWPYLRKIAKRMGYLLYYDHSGYLTLRRLTKDNELAFNTEENTAWTFSTANTLVDGERFWGNVVTMSSVYLDSSRYKNLCSVWAKKNKNAKTATLLATYMYDNANEFGSIQDLARNDVKRILPITIKRNRVMTLRKAKKLAKETLRRASLSALDVQFEALPAPHMELESTLRLMRPSKPSILFTPSTWTLPLVPGLQSIGFHNKMALLPERSGSFVRRRKKRKRHKNGGGK